jgi:hypothetical protein
MTEQKNMTDAEWEYLQRTLEAAMNAIIIAHPGGDAQEGLAVIQGWAEAPKRFPGNRFVGRLFQAMPGDLRKLNEEMNPNPHDTAESIISGVVEMCRTSAALLKAKAPEEQGTYRSIVLFLINKVARAAKEGGFLGIGGQLVSDAEKSVIDRLTAVL